MGVSSLLDQAVFQRARRPLGPRPGLLVGFAAVVLALLGAFTYFVLDSQAQSRREAARRFGAEARISAELTAAIFTTTATSGQVAAAKEFGGRTVDEGALTALAKRSRSGYMLILGADGKLLAASRGAPAVVRSRAKAPTHIRKALAGRASLSDVLSVGAGGRVLEWALPFETPFGRRVQVQSLDSGLIFRFLSGYLAGTRSDASGLGYVLDSQGRLVGSSGGAAKPGDRPKAPGLLAALASGGSEGKYGERGAGRYFVSAPVR